jgi:hypothetical protein
MTHSQRLLAVVAVLGLLLLGRAVTAQQGEFKVPGPAPEMEILKPGVGTWDAHVKFYMDPSKPPQESTGVMKRTVTMNGRFVEEKYEGKVFGEQFKGYGVAGYDPVKKMYSAFWIDSMSNQMMVMYGTYDAKAKTFTYTGEEETQFVKGKLKVRDVLRVINDNEQVFEAYRTPEGGKEFKMMEIKYTRKAK